MKKFINNLDIQINKKFKSNEFKYLLFILFIIPFALLYHPFINSKKEIIKTQKNIRKNIQIQKTTKTQIQVIQSLNQQSKYKLKQKKLDTIKLNNIEDKLKNIKKKLKYFKLNNEEWINILNNLINYTKSNLYSINDIKLYINNNNNITYKKTNIINKNNNSNFLNMENTVKNINKKLDNKLKLLKPKFYIYLNIKGNNFHNFLNIIKEIENTQKIKIIYMINNNNNNNKNSYSLLIIYMTT